MSLSVLLTFCLRTFLNENNGCENYSEPSVCVFLIFFSPTSTPRKSFDARGMDIIRSLCATGLGIYGDSNSESEEEQSEHGQIQNDDSDEELIVSGII